MAFKIGTLDSNTTSLLDVDTVNVSGLADSSYSTILASKRTLDLSNFNSGAGYTATKMAVKNGVIAVSKGNDSDGNGDSSDAWGSVRLFNENSLKEYCILRNPRAPDSSGASEFGADVIMLDNKLVVIKAQFYNTTGVFSLVNNVGFLYNLDSLGTKAFGPNLDSAQPEYGVNFSNFKDEPDGVGFGMAVDTLNGRFIIGNNVGTILNSALTDSIGRPAIYKNDYDNQGYFIKANESLNMFASMPLSENKINIHDCDGNVLHQISTGLSVDSGGHQIRYFDFDRTTIIHDAKTTNVPFPSLSGVTYTTDFQIRDINGNSVGYIDLNPNADSEQAHISNYAMGDGYIYVRQKNKVCRIYDYEGNLVEHLGTIKSQFGRTEIIQDSKLYVLDSNKVNIFDLPKTVDTYYESLVNRYKHDGA